MNEWWHSLWVPMTMKRITMAKKKTTERMNHSAVGSTNQATSQSSDSSETVAFAIYSLSFCGVTFVGGGLVLLLRGRPKIYVFCDTNRHMTETYTHTQCPLCKVWNYFVMRVSSAKLSPNMTTIALTNVLSSYFPQFTKICWWCDATANSTWAHKLENPIYIWRVVRTRVRCMLAQRNESAWENQQMASNEMKRTLIH